MENIEILKEINGMLKMCQVNINIKSVKETESMISDIEKLIGEYKAEDDIEKLIIKNRTSDMKNLKIICQTPRSLSDLGSF